jgi:hypothetical protein
LNLSIPFISTIFFSLHFHFFPLIFSSSSLFPSHFYISCLQTIQLVVYYTFFYIRLNLSIFLQSLKITPFSTTIELNLYTIVFTSHDSQPPTPIVFLPYLLSHPHYLYYLSFYFYANKFYFSTLLLYKCLGW